MQNKAGVTTCLFFAPSWLKVSVTKDKFSSPCILKKSKERARGSLDRQWNVAQAPPSESSASGKPGAQDGTARAPATALNMEIKAIPVQ